MITIIEVLYSGDPAWYYYGTSGTREDAVAWVNTLNSTLPGKTVAFRIR